MEHTYFGDFVQEVAKLHRRDQISDADLLDVVKMLSPEPGGTDLSGCALPDFIGIFARHLAQHPANKDRLADILQELHNRVAARVMDRRREVVGNSYIDLTIGPVTGNVLPKLPPMAPLPDIAEDVRDTQPPDGPDDLPREPTRFGQKVPDS